MLLQHPVQRVPRLFEEKSNRDTLNPEWVCGGLGNGRPGGLGKFNPDQSLKLATPESAGIENIGKNDGLANQDAPATLTDRLHRAEALCHAIAECEPADAAYLLAGIAARMCVSLPTSNSLADAQAWAASATPDSLRAVAFASFEAMPADMQNAFAAYATRACQVSRSLGPIFAEVAAEWRAQRDRRQLRGVAA